MRDTPTVNSRAVLLACSRKKRSGALPVQAIDRYDGPCFRVLRAAARDGVRCDSVWILSAKYGLIAGADLIADYDEELSARRAATLASSTVRELERRVAAESTTDLFVSLAGPYLAVLQGWHPRQPRVTTASGPIGARASQLRLWLRGRPKASPSSDTALPIEFRGVTIALSRDTILQEAKVLATKDDGARRFQTRYVEVDGERIAPKWLVSMLTDIPVSDFRTSDAVRVLSSLGIEVLYT